MSATNEDHSRPTRHKHRGGAPSSTSVLKNATNTRIKNSSLTVINNIQPPQDAASVSLKPLYDRVAPNAILNAGGRADEVRCYPGTREEVISLAERWMDDPDGLAPNLMWLSGPAGAGKTAIIQTIAERGKERGVQTASFFFFRSDTTRSTARPLVATLLYQIFRFYPATRDAVATVLSDYPLLFDHSVQEQFEHLLSSPLQDVPTVSESRARRPIVLLIDGLDECESENTSAQKQILQALDRLLTQPNSPFLALVASRAEPHLTMAFKHISSPVKSIFLDDQYQPEKDIRLFVNAEFRKVKETHHLAHTLASNWPLDDDVESIIQNSSGQFIFAATVMRYLANSSASPKISLDRVQGIVPVATNTPFAHLDAIYTYIFSRVDDREAVLDFLATQLLNDSMDSFLNQEPTLHAYDPRYTPEYLLSSIADLTALMQFDGRGLNFFHASLPDFLQDQSRPGEFFIDLYAFGIKILPTLSIMAPDSVNASQMGLELLSKLKTPTPEITKIFLTIQPHPDLGIHCHGFEDAIFQGIHKLYHPHDVKTYKKILHRWVSWYVSWSLLKPDLSNLELESRSLPNITMYIRMSKVEHWVTNTLKTPVRVKKIM